MRYFNTEGVCRPDEHYMVRLDDRLRNIKRLYVDRRKYFVINRGRQYGKTTTLRALEEYLKGEYLVVSMDFQGISTEEFADAGTFVCAFAKIRQLDKFKKLRSVVERILFQGKQTALSPAEKYMNLGRMFGFLKEENGSVVIANRIFEMYLLELFVAEESLNSEMFSYFSCCI